MSSIRNLENLYLNVPYEKREWAKNEGLRFDGEGKCWYLPAGRDPLDFRDYWAYLENTFPDREELKRRGCRYNRNLKRVYVPESLDFDDFINWWPKSLKPLVFNDRYVAQKLHSEKSGQADVYQAWDVQDGGYYAVKCFKSDVPGLSTTTLKKTFNLEMQALLQLDKHPNILKLTDWGQLNYEGSTRHFIISPWSDCGTLQPLIGATDEEQYKSLLRAMDASGYDLSEEDEAEILHELLSDETPTDPWLDKARLLIGIIDGISHAHSKGIYHRDIKPMNILLDLPDLQADQNFDTNFVPVLCDFGTSKAIDIHDADNLIRSKHTVVDMRTPPYRPDFSPSSKQGQKELKNQQTWDLFSWAIIAIELIGNEPVEGEEEARDLLETKIAESLDEPIVNLIRLAMAQDPDERPKDIRIFRREINKYTEKRRKQLGWG